MQRKQLLSLHDMAYGSLFKQGLFKLQVPADLPIIYQHRLTSIVESIIYEKLLPDFLHAVIDEDREKVIEMLESNRELLLIDNIPDNLVIESKLTFQKFYAENPLIFAAKRKQLDMLELMLSYYDTFPQTDEIINTKTKVLSAWNCIDGRINTIETGMTVPVEYMIYIQSLIDLFIKEEFLQDDTDRLNLSKETIEALDFLLRKILLPEHPVSLDNYIDAELLLIATYKTYILNFAAFQNWTQRYSFCICVIGLIQNAVIPETAKIFCQGISEVVTNMEKTNEKKIGENAKNYRLRSGEPFYRTSPYSQLGLGFEWLCGIFGTPAIHHVHRLGHDLLEKIYLEKNSKFINQYAVITPSVYPSPNKW